MRIWKLVGFIACWLAGVLPANAQVGGAAVISQTVHTSPRIHSLGEATVALRGYAGAAAINPAAIGLPEHVQLSSDIRLASGGTPLLQSPWLSLGENELWITAPYADVKLGRWAVAYQYKRFDMGSREYRDAQNRPVEVVRAYDQSHKLSAAWDLNAQLAVGAGVSLIESSGIGVSPNDLRPQTARSVSLDLGAYYEHPVVTKVARITPSVGWSLTDLGPRIDYGMSKDPLPMTMRGGLSVQAMPAATFLNRPPIRIGVHGALSKVLVGFEIDDENTFRSYGPFEALVKGWKPIKVRSNALNDPDGEYETLSVAEQLRQHTGLELSVLDIASLRWGRFYEHELNGGRQFSTWGWSIDLYYVVLERSQVTDAGDVASLEDVDFWRLTARVPLNGSDEANFWKALIDALRGR